jgi:hypothetical protein
MLELVLTTVLCVVAQVSGTLTLPLASDGKNLWVVSDHMTATGVERQIYHHSVEMNGGYARKVLTLKSAPEALTASDGVLWLVMPAMAANRPRRELYSIAASRHEPTGVFVYQPNDRLRLLGSVRHQGEHVAAAHDGHMVLVQVPPAQVERLAPAGWEPVSGAPQAGRLIQWGAKPALLSQTRPLSATVLDEPNVWRTQPLDLPEGATVTAVSGTRRPTVIVTLADGTSVLAYVNGNTTAPIAALPRLHGPWGVAALGDGFALVEAAPDGALAMREIDGIHGEVSEPVLLASPPTPAGEWIHIPLLGMLLTALLLSIFLMKHVGPQARLAAPYGFIPLSLRRRAVGLAIDLVPGAVLVVVLGYPLRSLLQLPMFSPSTAAAVPGTIWVLVTLGLCALLEVTTGASLGKWIVGGRLARMVPPGARPALWQVLARSVFKGMILLVPLVGLLVVLAPGGRGVGEVLSGTAVISRRPGTTQPLKNVADEGR